MTIYKPIEAAFLKGGHRIRMTSKKGSGTPIPAVVNHVVRVDKVAYASVNIDGSDMHTRIDLNEWNFEVQVRPLPTANGLYTLTPRDLNGALFYHEDESWTSDLSGKWADVDPEQVPEGIVRLVPEPEAEGRERIGVRLAYYALRKDRQHNAADTLLRAFPEAFKDMVTEQGEAKAA